MKCAGFEAWVRRAAHMALLSVISGVTSLSSLHAANVILAWDASSDPAVVGYKVYYGCSSRGYTNIVEAGSATSVTISNLVSGATYWFAATTYSVAGLESDYSAEASYAVPAVTQNRPPTLDTPADLTINQDAGAQTVIITGISAGSPTENQTLTVTAFSGNTGLIPNPTVDYTSPQNTGTILFTPVPGASGACTLTVMVDDGGTVSNTVIRVFTVTVNAINAAPTLDPVADIVLEQNSAPQTVNLTGISSGSPTENQTLVVTATSDNRAVIPDPTISYRSPDSTATLTLKPATNAFGSSVITAVVSDGQGLNNTISRSFKVTVNQLVTPGILLTNTTISPNQVLKFVLNPPITNGHKFTFSLDATAPVGAKISTRKGIPSFVWVPSSEQASTTNLIVIRATDTTDPAITTNELVQVTVLDYMEIIAGRITVQAGQKASLPIGLTSSEGVTNLSFLINWPAERFSAPSLSLISSNTASGTVQVQGTNLLVSIKTSPKQPLEGSNIVAFLDFTTLSNQSSAFVGMPVSSITALKPAGSSYINRTAQLGEVVVVGDAALLMSTLTPTGTRQLILYGKVGTAYQVQSSTSLSSGAPNWNSFLTYTQTNIEQTLSVSGTAPLIFYRLKQQ